MKDLKKTAIYLLALSLFTSCSDNAVFSSPDGDNGSLGEQDIQAIEVSKENTEVHIFEENDFIELPSPTLPRTDCRYDGNFIDNGSFEEIDQRQGLIKNKSLVDLFKNKGWDIFADLPSSVGNENSWEALKGVGVEVQSNGVVKQSPYGVLVIELDSHGKNSNSSIHQRIKLCKGEYSLSFVYLARSKKENDNTILISLDDKEISEVNLTQTGDWVQVHQTFKINKENVYDFSISALGIENTIGGLVDGIFLLKN